MLATPHTIAGAALGAAVGNPYIAFSGGILLHHALDSLPHTDLAILHYPEQEYEYTKTDWIIVLTDATIGVITFFSLALVSQMNPSVIAGMVGGVLPDLLTNVPIIKQKMMAFPPIGWYYRTIHRRLQWRLFPRQWYLGVITQLLVIVGGLWYLFSIF